MAVVRGLEECAVKQALRACTVGHIPNFMQAAGAIHVVEDMEKRLTLLFIEQEFS